MRTPRWRITYYLDVKIPLNSFKSIECDEIRENAAYNMELVRTYIYGTPEGTFLFQYLPEKKSKQKELERKSKQ